MNEGRQTISAEYSTNQQN